jgi:hypothetical protein
MKKKKPSVILPIKDCFVSAVERSSKNSGVEAREFHHQPAEQDKARS